MTYEQLLKHYGSLSKASQALGLSRQTVNYWRKAKRIPDDWQIAINQKTGLQLDRVAKRKALAFAEALRGPAVAESA